LEICLMNLNPDAFRSVSSSLNDWHHELCDAAKPVCRVPRHRVAAVDQMMLQRDLNITTCCE
jgi:hypothetical protein